MFPELTLLVRRGESRPSLLAFGLEERDGLLVAPAFAVKILRDYWRKGTVFDAYANRGQKRLAKLKLAEGVSADDRIVRFEPLRFEFTHPVSSN